MQLFWSIFDAITHIVFYYCMICYIIWITLSIGTVLWDSLRIKRLPHLVDFSQGIIPFVSAPILIPFSFYGFLLFLKNGVAMSEADKSFQLRVIERSITKSNEVLAELNSVAIGMPGTLLENPVKRSMIEATIYMKSVLESLERGKKRLTEHY